MGSPFPQKLTFVITLALCSFAYLYYHFVLRDILSPRSLDSTTINRTDKRNEESLFNKVFAEPDPNAILKANPINPNLNPILNPNPNPNPNPDPHNQNPFNKKKKRHKKKRKPSITKQPSILNPPKNQFGNLTDDPMENLSLPKYLRTHVWAPDRMSKFSACPTPIDMSVVRSYAAADWFSTHVSDVTRCYCELWSYYMDHARAFHGESGLEAFHGLISRISSDFRMSSLNIFANLSPRSKYFMDMLHAVGDQLYIDVGSNPIRQVKLLQSLEPFGKRFFFFEPNPLKHRLIHTAMQKEKRVTLIPIALSESPGQMSLDARPFHSTANIAATPKATTGLTVNVTTLDDYLLQENLNHVPIPILSIDAEGYDIAILRGARDTLGRVRMVLFECHRMMRPSTPQTPGGTHYEVQELLVEYGFMTFKMSKLQWIPFTGHWYHIAVDTPIYMGWDKCIALRHDDPFLDRVWPEYNTLKSCQYNPYQPNKKN